MQVPKKKTKKRIQINPKKVMTLKIFNYAVLCEILLTKF